MLQCEDYNMTSNDKYVAPLNSSQLGVYLDSVDEPETIKYNLIIAVRLSGNIDAGRFIAAAQKVADMYPVLGSHIGTVNGVPSLVSGEGGVKITEKYEDTAYVNERRFRHPFDLETGPLARMEYVHTPDGDAFVIDAHHTVFDGTSVNVLVRNIVSVYNGGEPVPETVTMFEAARAEAEYVNEEKLREYEAYFEEKLGGVDCDSKPVRDVVTDGAPAGFTSVTDTAEGIFTGEEVADFVKSNGLTENAFFLGAFGYTLAKYNASPESCFATGHTGRLSREVANTVGMFVRTLPFVCRPDENESPAKYLSRVSDDYYFTKKNDVISFAELAAKYGVGKDVTFVFQSDLFADIPIDGGTLTPEMLDTDTSIADFELMAFSGETNGVLVHYNTAEYSEAFVRGFVRTYLHVVRGMLREEKLGDIELCDPDARALIDSFNKTEKPYDTSRTVVDLFREQAKRTPDAECLVYCDKRFTYRETDEITDRIAKHLREWGVCRGKVVGVLIPRCEYMLLCSLAVLKAGGAYLPLDPTYPPERLNLMVKDSGASLLFTTAELDSVITDDFTGRRVPVDSLPSLPDIEAPLPAPVPEDLFVMLYTSGSTGTPKGVMFAHSNTMVTAAWERDFYELGEGCRVTAYASYGFDANVFDTYATITSGATLHIISDDIRLDLIALRDYYNENGITHSTMTTQVGRQFALMGGTKTLRCLNVAGEKLTPLTPPEGLAFYNLYGPTEGSILATGFRVDKFYRDVPIGRAVDNVKLYVVDSLGRLLPPGASGELLISGAHVTQGYMNRPEKTAEAYGENIYDNVPGYERIYRTGDVVRFMHDGNLQFVGRRDAQVKVRGFRVELTEIEEVIRRCPGVRDVTVAAFDEPSGGKFIAAYIVSDENINFDTVAEFIKAEKPPYMVPAVFMKIDKIPLNQNQKVNRRALPVPERTAGEVVPPETEMQKKIFGIVASVVGHEQFGITTDIYEAGLTSIGAIRLNVALSEEFGCTVRIADVKANDTVKKLEAFLSSAAPSKTFALQADYPLTATQNGIIVECLANPGTTVYNIPALFRLGDGVDTERLVRAAKCAVDAHPYLKTVLFTDAGGNVRAERRDGDEACVTVEKCAALPESIVYPFTLLGERLYRITVFETDAGNYLFIDIHHVISDGTSESIILRDISSAYAGETLTPETYSGFEAALDEEEVRAGDAYTSAKEYWKGALAGAETECLPKKEPSGESGAGFITRRVKTDPAKIESFCDRAGITPNAFFNSAFSFVLSRFAGKDSVSYATVYSGRNDSRLENTVTLAVRTLPIAVEFTDGMTVAETVGDMQKKLMGAMSNDAVPFSELASDFGVNADVMFIYQGDTFTFDTLCGEKTEMTTLTADAAKAPVAVNLYKKDGAYEYTVEFRRDCFGEGFAEALVDAVDACAVSFTENALLREVSLMTDASRALYASLNDSVCEIEKIPVYKFVERHAEEKPDAKAVTSAGRTITWKELNDGANRIANKLLSLGVKRGDVVALVLDRCCEIPVTEMAINKAGGAFVAVLPSYPDERIDYCLTDAGSPIVITTEQYKNERASLFAADKPYRTLTLEELLSDGDTSDPDVPVTLSDLAYCIYTSGSTGNPKGVMIEHVNFTNMVQTHFPIFSNYLENPEDRPALASCSVSFDASIMDTYVPLAHGEHVVVCTEEEHHDPVEMLRLMLEHKIGMMVSTPSYLTNLVSMPEFAPAFAGMKSLMSGAEAFPKSLFDGLRAASPELQIMNGYGPSECTVCCSYKEITDGGDITIGKSTGNVKLYVADKFGNDLPAYAVGELIITGDGVGRGYMKLPDKTRAAFFEKNGGRAYRSGDLVRLNANGEVDFGGRRDNQIKLRGFRIELDEIENVMREYPGVKQSKILVRSNGSDEYLVGFFTAESEVDIDALTAHMKSKLTYYMVPAVLMQLDAMPLTPNGKIDKNGFPETVKRTAERKSGRTAKKSLEQKLCETFASVLGQDVVYADDNFFELGGTSLTASKVTMLLMSAGTEVKYGDIFDNPTPETLAAFIEERDGVKKEEAKPAAAVEDKTREALRYNTVKYAHEVKRKPLGGVLLTGAVGFLGIHILDELLRSEEGHIWVLVRKGSHADALTRLKTMLVYYFGRSYDDVLRERVTVIDADITDASLGETLRDVPLDTVINSAACVKHFTDDDILERINVRGVENLISICEKRGVRLVQISTVSVPGIHTEESYENHVSLHENELFVIDDMDNKYAISKYNAELRMFDAIERGMSGKVIRVGNLMGRHSDGEFQVNFETNMFLRGLRGFAVMGMYPISHMTDPMSFSPVDCTAKAVVLLAGVDDKFTAFNATSRYGFDEMKIIDACNANGITIVPPDDDEYYARFREKLGDDSVNELLNGLAAYDIKDAHAVEADTRFTTNILYRIGFSWPLIDDSYLERAINSMLTLDYFNIDDGDYN